MNLYNFFWTGNSVRRNELTAKYEPVQPFLFLSLIKRLRCEVVFDVGANIGFYSLLSSLSDTVKSIHAFEAIEEPYREILENVEMNNLESLINVHNVAVSNKNMDLAFLVNEDPLSGINASKESTFHDKKKYSQERKVKAVLIDDLIDILGQNIAFKIDVEGHELSVIEGSVKTLKNNTCFVQVECFPKNRELLISRFIELGYFMVYELHHDLYFSNAQGLKDLKSINDVIKQTLNLFIKNGLGKFPDKIGRKSELVGSFKIVDKDKIEVSLYADQSVFSSYAEYAFYLIVDGKKKDTVWYTDNNTVQFSIPGSIDLKRVSIKGFVRNKKLPDKKISIDIKPSVD